MLQESLHEVGRRWQANTISVADEHAATAVVQYVLSVLFEYLPRAPAKGNAVVAGVLGERHQVGAHMIADLFEVEGWRTRFLGTDVPTDAILDAVERHDAQLVALGVTMPANLPSLAYLVANVRSRFGNRVRIVVGGQAASLIDVKTLGADSFAPDARAALELMRTVKGS